MKALRFVALRHLAEGSPLDGVSGFDNDKCSPLFKWHRPGKSANGHLGGCAGYQQGKTVYTHKAFSFADSHLGVRPLPEKKKKKKVPCLLQNGGI